MAKTNAVRAENPKVNPCNQCKCKDPNRKTCFRIAESCDRHARFAQQQPWIVCYMSEPATVDEQKVIAALNGML